MKASRVFLDTGILIAALNRRDQRTTSRRERSSPGLRHLRGSRLTCVDAASLALMEQYGIGTVWGTDYHLGLTGAEVLPRV